MTDKEKKSAEPKNAASSTEDAGQAEVQQMMDEANEQGYFGEVPDPTPNENYTVQGVASGKPTPETDADAHAKAAAASRTAIVPPAKE